MECGIPLDARRGSTKPFISFFPAKHAAKNGKGFWKVQCSVGRLLVTFTSPATVFMGRSLTWSARLPVEEPLND
jgi:hypothetical protein